jgi:CheY-like chemotaxis protein
MTMIFLYVEDDEQSREIMRVIVEDIMQIAHIHIFEDSQDFLARASALSPRPNLILLDIHVEPYNGFEMLAQLRGSVLYQNTPVVALTASVMNEEVDRLRQAGFDGVIAKPVDLDNFPTIVHKIMNGEMVWNIAP